MVVDVVVACFVDRDTQNSIRSRWVFSVRPHTGNAATPELTCSVMSPSLFIAQATYVFYADTAHILHNIVANLTIATTLRYYSTSTLNTTVFANITTYRMPYHFSLPMTLCSLTHCYSSSVCLSWCSDTAHVMRTGSQSQLHDLPELSRHLFLSQ
jgi:hypothetical protein